MESEKKDKGDKDGRDDDKQPGVCQRCQDTGDLYLCGKNINPPLRIDNVPAGTRSLALIVDDPDAPAGVWVHWLVWNIDPHSREIAEDTVPREAVVGKNDWHHNMYGGPCPPSGTHRYLFKLFALDASLELVGSASKHELEDAMEGHVLAQAQLVGLYARG